MAVEHNQIGSISHNFSTSKYGVCIYHHHDSGADELSGSSTATSVDTSAGSTSGAPKHKAYLTPSAVQAGLRSGTLLQGTFHASRDSSTEAHVSARGTFRIILVTRL